MGTIFYIARVLGTLQIVCSIFSVITSILLAVVIGGVISKEIESKTPAIVLAVIVLLNLAGAIFIPSKEEYLTIVAADAIEQSVWNRASETKDGKTIPEKTITLLDILLDKEIEKLQKDTSDL